MSAATEARTGEVALGTTAERRAVTGAEGQAPAAEWVIVTRGIKRHYD
ncbi:MAG: hypothetical protein HY275_12110 [Gemmatimonadetes bacterium]|nr:hypothetical protein [Gemmatimonadota bacterium]